MIWDGLPSHRSKVMKAWIASQRHWLVVERLPAYGHELNPVELIWGNLKSSEPATLRAELEITRAHYNGIRLHQGIGYVTPNDEHQGRGEAIRKARQAGLETSRLRRLAWHHQHRQDQPVQEPDDVG